MGERRGRRRRVERMEKKKGRRKGRSVSGPGERKRRRRRRLRERQWKLTHYGHQAANLRYLCSATVWSNALPTLGSGEEAVPSCPRARNNGSSQE